MGAGDGLPLANWPNHVCGIYFQLIFLCIFGVVPDLETVKFKVLSRRDQYEIREIEVLLKASIFFRFHFRHLAITQFSCNSLFHVSND